MTANWERLKLELDDWRGKYKTLELNFNTMKSQYELKITEFTNLLSLRDKELSDWKSKYAALEAKYAALELKFSSFGATHSEFELKITKLTAEVDRLNGLLRDKQTEIDDLRNRLARAE